MVRVQALYEKMRTITPYVTMQKMGQASKTSPLHSCLSAVCEAENNFGNFMVVVRYQCSLLRRKKTAAGFTSITFLPSSITLYDLFPVFSFSFRIEEFIVLAKKQDLFIKLGCRSAANKSYARAPLAFSWNKSARAVSMRPATIR